MNYENLMFCFQYLVDASESKNPDTGTLDNVEIFILCRKKLTDPEFEATLTYARNMNYSLDSPSVSFIIYSLFEMNRNNYKN